VTTTKKVLIGVGVIVVLGAVVAASMMGKKKEKGEPVYMAKAEKRTLVSAVSATGLLQPKTKVNVQSMVIGEIVKLPVKEGDRVAKGDLLVQIDPQQYRTEVDRLDAMLRMNRISIEQQQVALANARKILARQQDLQQKGFVSPESFERAELDARVGEINLKSLDEQVTQAAAALDKARDALTKTTIRTPIGGIVTKLNAELGEMTMTGTMNNPGTVIMVVSDMSEVLAEVDVDENRIVKVKPGQSARVVVDAIGELHPYSGKVTEIAGTAVKRAGQEVQVFPVKIALDQPDERLRPGMTSKARIETERATDAVTVPIQSVLLKTPKEIEAAMATHGSPKSATPATATVDASSSPDGDKQEVVFKVEGGKAALTKVRSGLSDETGVVIVDGLKEGDTVITGPYRAVKAMKNGDLVRKKEDKKADEGKDKPKGKDDKDADGPKVEVDAS
jgi:HlyD family secretion protein